MLDLKAGSLFPEMRVNASTIALVQLTRFWLDISLGTELLVLDKGDSMLVYSTNWGFVPSFMKTVSRLTVFRVVV